jgi:hypothetical protein
VGGGVAAYATQTSDSVSFYNGDYCAKVQTISNNDTPERAQTNVRATTACIYNTAKTVASGYLGSNAALKKTSGAVCRSIGTSYTTATASGHTSNAYWTSSACGTSVQLQATGTGYAYNGSGYTTKYSAAPFQVYP